MSSKEWQKCASANAAQIHRWWRHYPKAVPGIWCGRPDLDLLVMDPDRHDGGGDAVEAFAQLVWGWSSSRGTPLSGAT